MRSKIGVMIKIEKSDGSIFFGLVYLSILSIAIWFVAYLLYKKGYKLKS